MGVTSGLGVITKAVYVIKLNSGPDQFGVISGLGVLTVGVITEFYCIHIEDNFGKILGGLKYFFKVNLSRVLSLNFSSLRLSD